LPSCAGGSGIAIHRAPTRRSIAWLVGVVLFASVAWPIAPEPVSAQTATPPVHEVASLDLESAVAIDFPRGMTISTAVEWDDIYNDAWVEVLYTVAGDDTANLAFVPLAPVSASGEMALTATLDLQAQFVPSGVSLDFWWRVVSDDGPVAESAPEQTFSFDDRRQWQQLQTDKVPLHYYAHEPAFAQEMLDASQATVSELEQRFSLAQSAPLDIWVYPSSEDFRGAQQPNSRESIAGASYPGYFLIVAVVPDGSTNEVGRVVLHEVSHQILYQATDNPFTYPPLWFDEGMATHFQVGGTDGFMEMVVRAHRDGTLFDITSLDVSFPYLPAQATLAYATSWSVVEYIEVTWSDDGISRLIAAFATGVPYDEALVAALGVDSDELNEDWRTWVASQAG